MIVKTVLIILCACILQLFAVAQKAQYPFQNTNLPFDERVDNLVSQLTLEEKVSQMLNAAPAIPRLGIPAYDWWNEVLHGVARSPYKVTVYPQAIAMAANFDTAAMHVMADFSASEGRAIFNEANKSGKTGQRYVGLTYWTPNINIFRDPRWGRGQETYGEDPFLTGSLGKAFVMGLQGDDEKYLKAAACAKHYAVHSGPEPSRHVFDVSPSTYDLWDTYLPAFKKLVTQAKVAGVMCAYNAFQGQPCCGSDVLMTDILRNQWHFTGYVTSDCWAIDDFFKNHKTHPDAESAAADAVMHGTDIDCGTSAYKALVQAVKDKKIAESQIDISLKRLFMIRFRLGMFDPVEMVKYAQTSATELESEPHKQQSLKMAEQSMVLLRNDNYTLPLSKNLKKIVVLGPNADNAISVLGNYNGTPTNIVTVLDGIKKKVGSQTQVIYEKAVNFTNDTLLVYNNLKNQYFLDGKSGFKAEYFDNMKLEGKPVATRMEDEVDNNWQEGEMVVGNLKAYNFSARYTTDFKPLISSEITFELDADDGYRFTIDGKELLNAWTRNRWGVKTLRFQTEAGKTYRLVLEYFQDGGKATVKLKTGKFEKNNFQALSNRIKDADAIVFVGGISPQLEGEEMKVDFPGFNGGDRTSIMLPKVQTDLMKALQSAGKPLVFVMMTGSALAIPWEATHVPAIINAWYGGQSAGTAVANVLFGDYNPSGRLPITFYASDNDLPPFEDYSMRNRTYRYFKGNVLYPFGFGLSYTNFIYAWSNLPKNSYHEKDTIQCSLKISNAGKLEGDEVVQTYIVYPQTNKPLPLKELRQFNRIHLSISAGKGLNVNIPIIDLQKWDDIKKAFVIEPGTYKIFIGGSSQDEKLSITFKVE